MSKPSNTSLKVNCPTCKKTVAWDEDSPFRPFCSDRCQKIDLGAWADESYSIPVENAEEWSDSQTNRHSLGVDNNTIH